MTTTYVGGPNDNFIQRNQPYGYGFGITANFGDVIEIQSGTVYSDTVNTSGSQNVNAGGLSNGTVLNAYGTENVYAGGQSFSTIVDRNGAEIVWAGGFAVGTMVADGGFETVFAGGQASGATVQSGGQIRVYGITANTTVAAGGEEDIFAGGIAAGTSLSGISRIYSGGTAGRGSVNSGGVESVNAGGSAAWETVTSGGLQDVSGSVNNTTLQTGAREVVHAGGTTSDTVIAGGSLDALAGATVKGAITFSLAATSPTSTLMLDTGANLSGATVNGFGFGDAFDLTNVAFGAHTTVGYTGNASGGKLTVTDGSHSVMLAFAGDYTATTFVLSSDNTGGTRVTELYTGPTPEQNPLVPIGPTQAHQV